MRNIFSALALVAVLFVSGCASSPRSSSDETPSTSPTASEPTKVTPSARIAEPVNIPVASSRKLVVVMTGPKNVLDAKDWPDMKKEWRDTFADYAKQSGISCTFVDAAPAPSAEEGTLLMVTIADYRMVGIGMRILFGVMTGNAYMDAKVGYLNLRDGAKFGDQQYNTSSSFLGGIFSKVTPQQVDQIAASVFAEIKAAK
jgi:hypothetical protein